MPSHEASGFVTRPPDHVAEHAAGADQGEEALRLPRVGDDAGESPHRQAQQEVAHALQEPERLGDPRSVGGEPTRGRRARAAAIETGITMHARPRPMRASRAPKPSVARNIVPPRTRYITGSFSTP